MEESLKDILYFFVDWFWKWIPKIFPLVNGFSLNNLLTSIPGTIGILGTILIFLNKIKNK